MRYRLLLNELTYFITQTVRDWSVTVQCAPDIAGNVYGTIRLWKHVHANDQEATRDSHEVPAFRKN